MIIIIVEIKQTDGIYTFSQRLHELANKIVCFRNRVLSKKDMAK